MTRGFLQVLEAARSIGVMSIKILYLADISFSLRKSVSDLSVNLSRPYYVVEKTNLGHFPSSPLSLTQEPVLRQE
jgi:hypothetical protein